MAALPDPIISPHAAVLATVGVFTYCGSLGEANPDTNPEDLMMAPCRRAGPFRAGGCDFDWAAIMGTLYCSALPTADKPPHRARSHNLAPAACFVMILSILLAVTGFKLGPSRRIDQARVNVA
eukprot:m.74973 g.74973  ORF g.74973 m.74973 type:complete len:123 (+) comp8069_c0_seq3:602-970(+)